MERENWSPHRRFPLSRRKHCQATWQRSTGATRRKTGLAFQMLRAMDEIRPLFAVAENVANFLKVNGGRDFNFILSELSRMGYNAEWRTCYASEVGAPHKRKRLYIVAYPNSLRLETIQSFFSYVSETTSPFMWVPAGTAIQISRGGSLISEPPVLCVDDGIPAKLVTRQLHGYGNAIVPQIALQIFKAIEVFENNK